MMQVLYKEVPIQDIHYLHRQEFTENGPEKSFFSFLKESIAKYGLRDPVHIVYGEPAYGDILKVIVGNNRMVIATLLKINTIPSIIVNLKSDTHSIQGTVLETDEDIKNIFIFLINYKLEELKKVLLIK
jgi:ParB-like chromosome segregation protein Spo0J